MSDYLFKNFICLYEIHLQIVNYTTWFRMEDFMAVASQEGKPQWGGRDPPDTGCYNNFPSGVPFFEEGNDSFLSDYGRFFLVCYHIHIFGNSCILSALL